MSENEKKTLDLSVSMPTEQEPPADIWGDDALEREKFADDLTRIVKNAAEHKSFALSLHGDWGTGKTYLLQRWQKQLQKEGRQAVYFNAWEDDFQADPLTAIVGQLWKEIKKGDFAEIGESLKSLVGHLFKKALGAVSATKEDLQSPAERAVDEYLAMREKLDDLKERLEELAKAVKDSTGFPLVFIVDELDRCRPTFAIEVLERVKHLFNAPNIAFVFGVNKTELQKSIQSAYGDIDAEGYLRRFFDISLTLPPASTENYCDLLLKRHDLRGALGGWRVAMEEFFTDLVGYMNFSLREVEHAVRLLRYATNARIASGQTFNAAARGVALLILLKLSDSSLYSDFVARKCSCGKVIDHFDRLLPDYYYVVGREGMEGEDTHGDVWEAGRVAHMVRIVVYQFALDEGHAPAPRVEMHDIIEGLEAIASGNPVPDESIIPLGKHTVKLNARNAKSILRQITGRYPLEELAALLDLADDFH